MTQLRSFAQTFTVTEIFLAGLAGAGTFVLDRFLLSALFLLVLYWPVRWLAHGRPSVRTPMDWPILFLVVVRAPITLWATALPEVTRSQVMRLLADIGLFFGGPRRTSVLAVLDAESEPEIAPTQGDWATQPGLTASV